jgi:hypothetical protein
MGKVWGELKDGNAEMAKEEESKRIVKYRTELFNLIPDKPNTNGRIYSREVLESIVKQINEGNIFLHSDPPDSCFSDVDTMIASVSDAHVNDNGVSVTVEIFKTQKAKQLFKFLEETNSRITIAASGQIDEDSKVKNVKLISLFPSPHEPAEKKS